MTPKKFQQSVLTWFDKNGRKELPWQTNKTPYRVWVSEIMLQQTQVTTVIPYYQRFMQQFPKIKDLATAHEDLVLHLWTGLGYYTRARNLHRTAKIIHENFAGKFPNETTELEKLPGIGRSTAGAILSIAFQKPAAILDGNVKRVLTRFYNIAEWPGERKTHDKLWQLAEKLTPQERTADYAQAMMDLGATICTRSKPSCQTCPLVKSCSAYQHHTTHLIPGSKPKKSLPERVSTLILIQHEHHVLLHKRPPTGIWGGLWTPPQLMSHAVEQEIKDYCAQQLQLSVAQLKPLSVFRHTFSHFHLDILPVTATLGKKKHRIMDSEQQIWYNLQNPQDIGLPAPVKKLLENLR